MTWNYTENGHKVRYDALNHQDIVEGAILDCTDASGVEEVKYYLFTRSSGNTYKKTDAVSQLIAGIGLNPFQAVMSVTGISAPQSAADGKLFNLGRMFGNRLYHVICADAPTIDGGVVLNATEDEEGTVVMETTATTTQQIVGYVYKTYGGAGLTLIRSTSLMGYVEHTEETDVST